MSIHGLCRYIITKFVAKESINWPREIKIAQKLTTQYQEPEFWEKCHVTDRPLSTLAYFLAQSGQLYLSRQHDRYAVGELDQTEEIELESGPVSVYTGPIIEKPKTVLDFIRKTE